MVINANSARLRVLFLILTFLLIQASCGKTNPADSEAGVQSTASTEAVAAGTQLASNQGSSPGAVLAGEDKKEGEPAAPGDDEEDEEKKDEHYWDEIDFGWKQFDEMLEVVKSEYIESQIDIKRAYISAANLTLAMLEPGYEVIPASYHQAHKDDPDVIIEGEDRNDIVLKRREFFRKQQRELQESWEKTEFTRQDLERVVEFAQAQGKKAGKDAKPHRFVVSAAQGFLYALDPHSSLVSQKSWDDSTRKTHDSSFDGIGAMLTQRWEPSSSLKNRLRGEVTRVDKKDDFVLVQLDTEDKITRKTYVESPIQGQPAEKAGLWSGDEIIAVNGTSVEGEPLSKVVSMIRGPRGTQVKLTVVREGEQTPKDIVVTRSHIRVTNVEGRLLEHHPGVGYIKLTGFIESSFDEIVDELARLDQEAGPDGLKGLVFDLRANSGGLLQQAVRISDLFLSKGKIVTVKNRARGILSFMGGDEVYRAHKENTLDLPIVVLVNDGSASASEIVASAIQDNGRGLILGLRTFGKASVQTLMTPREGAGYYIKLTIARYYSPSDRTIQVVGVQPDVTIPPEFEGKIPVGFREEDLSNHLPPIVSEYESPNKDILEKVKPCMEKQATADNMAKSDPNPQVKFDYQLFVGADYIECMSEELTASSPCGSGDCVAN